MPGKRRKHVPLRTCIACHKKQPKRDLIRAVRTPEGTVEIDFQGKLPGRGAYFCSARNCWETALQPGVLTRLLKAPVSVEDTARLQEAVKSAGVQSVAEGQRTVLDSASRAKS